MKLLFRFFFTFCLLIRSHSLFAGPGTLHVLFIGNSFTQLNDLPGMVYDLAGAADIPFDYGMHYAFGASVDDFIHDSACWSKIKSQAWDYVVIQDNQKYYYGPKGKFDSSGHLTNLLENNIRFQDSIKKLIPCVKIIYFAGWEQDDGEPKTYPGDNTQKLIGRISVNYEYLNSQPGVHNIIAPVGAAWVAAIGRRPDFHSKPYGSTGLYARDGRHPNPPGSYLAACVLFSVITHRSPMGLHNRIQIPMYLDTLIKRIAWNTVADNYGYTHIHTFSPSVKIKKHGFAASSGYSAYQWYKDTAAIAGATSREYEPNDNDLNYYVRAWDKKGCTYWSFPAYFYREQLHKP